MFLFFFLFLYFFFFCLFSERTYEQHIPNIIYYFITLLLINFIYYFIINQLAGPLRFAAIAENMQLA